MVTVCRSCGSENSTGAVVCAHCSTPLVAVCPRCRFENPAGFNYCGNCGARLSPAESAPAPDDHPTLTADVARQGERRTVTVLFGDVVGFTSISERLDPDQVYSIIDACADAFRREIARHEGWLDKFVGDGVLALFGAPVAHEDDVVRALRCALGMQEAVERINADLAAAQGAHLQIRIGLNLGAAVVGDIGSDLRMSYTALGDTVNVAERLESAAEPGTVVVSRAVYEAASPWFEFRELGSLRVKGRAEPVDLFEVVRERPQPRPVRGLPGLTAPTVGRSRERDQLRLLVDGLCDGKRGGIALIRGEAGIGKSRLASEAAAYAARKGVSVFEAGCAAYGQPPYGVFSRLLHTYLRLDGVSPTEQRARVETRLCALLPDSRQAEEILPYVENLIGIPPRGSDAPSPIRHLDAAQLRQRTVLAVRDLLLAHAQREPLLLVLEDLHWVDTQSLGLLLFLFGATETAPLCLICTSRPAPIQVVEQIERTAQTTMSTFLNLALEPLSPEETAALTTLLLNIPELPDPISRSIQERAEGNPFFLEEIIRTLIDRRIIRQTDGHWQIQAETPLPELDVPRTVEGLIRTRLDRLSEAIRYTLEAASVIGRDFDRPLLEVVMGPRAAQVEEHVQELQELELIRPAAGEAGGQYTFRHILIQQTVYNSLISRRREYLHRRVAEGIEQLYTGQIEEYAERLAFHYAESKDAARALPYLLRAGERAAWRYANYEASEYYRAALQLANQAPASVQQRVEIFSGLGDAQNLMGDYAGAVASYRTALELCRTLPASALRAAEIARRLGRVFERRGESDEAMRWLQSASYDLRQAPDSDETVEHSRLELDIGWVHYRQGNLEAAGEAFSRALDIARRRDYRAEAASAYNRLAALEIEKSNWVTAAQFGEEGLRLREEIGDVDGVARSHINLGAIAGYRGDWEKAGQHFGESLRISQRLGQPKAQAMALVNLGRVEVMKGETAKARDYLSRALALAERIHDPEQSSRALNALAEVFLLERNWQAAAEQLRTSLRLSSETGSGEQQAQALWILAEAELGIGEMERAEAAAQEALRIATERGLAQIEGIAYRVLGAIDQQRGRPAEAESLLGKSIAVLGQLNPLEAARAELELGLLLEAQRRDSEADRALTRCRDAFARLGAEPYRVRAEEALLRLRTTSAGRAAVQTPEQDESN